MTAVESAACRSLPGTRRDCTHLRLPDRDFSMRTMTGLLWGLRHPRTQARRILKRLRRRPMTRRGRKRHAFLNALSAVEAPEAVPAIPRVRAAVAAGPRLTNGLAWEWTQTALDQRSWRNAVDGRRFDILVIEISDGSVPGWDPVAVRSLLEWSRSAGVPSVAWVVGAERVRSLGWEADLVQEVFIDCSASLSDWRRELPTKRVGVLEPAAQPRLHNPRQGKRRERAVGVVVHEPSSDLMTAAAGLPGNLVDIWPASPEIAAGVEAAGHSGSLVPRGYEGLLSQAINRYSVFTEAGADDDTELPWRVTDAGCSGTCVVVEKDDLARLPDGVGEHVTIAEKPDELAADIGALMWQPELRDRAALRLTREVHTKHTFAHRAAVMADAVGVRLDRPGRSVSAVVPTNRAHEIDNIFQNIARQRYQRDIGVELVLVLHGLDLSHAELRSRARDAGVAEITLVVADQSMTLGTCMNLGVEAAGGDYIAKMDDDNFYGRHYLTDLVSAFGYTDAGIVGKWAHYVWLRSTGAVLLRCPYAEHRPERLVQGGSILMKGDVARELRFSDIPRAVDTDLLDRALEAGVMTYSADRFNFVSIRNGDRAAHTWTIADAALMNRAASVVFYGDPREHVDI